MTATSRNHGGAAASVSTVITPADASAAQTSAAARPRHRRSDQDRPAAPTTETAVTDTPTAATSAASTVDQVERQDRNHREGRRGRPPPKDTKNAKQPRIPPSNGDGSAIKPKQAPTIPATHRSSMKRQLRKRFRPTPRRPDILPREQRNPNTAPPLRPATASADRSRAGATLQRISAAADPDPHCQPDRDPRTDSEFGARRCTGAPERPCRGHCAARSGRQQPF
jgi:hypothetical protein